MSYCSDSYGKKVSGIQTVRLLISVVSRFACGVMIENIPDGMYVACQIIY